jgi:hypothetical protein
MVIPERFCIVNGLTGKVLFYERSNTMKRMVIIMCFVFMGLMLSGAQAALLYSHSFDDLTDIAVSGCGTVAVSSEQSVESGNSLKFSGDIAGDAPQAVLTPTIGGGENTDQTITYIVRYYVTSNGGVDDHANTRTEGTNVGTATGRSTYYQNDKMWWCTGGAWTSSNTTWPLDGWFTIAVECDTTSNNQYRFYAAPGTDVTTSDRVSDWQSGYHSNIGPLTKWTFWSHYSGVGSDWYLDKFEIYSELGEGIVPEPASIGLLMLGFGFLVRRRK